MENAGQTKVYLAILQILKLRMIGGNEGGEKKEREQSKDTEVKQTSPFPEKFALREQEIAVRHDAGSPFFSLVKEFFIVFLYRVICLERDFILSN